MSIITPIRQQVQIVITLLSFFLLFRDFSEIFIYFNEYEISLVSKKTLDAA